jgi:hypothetical protein
MKIGSVIKIATKEKKEKIIPDTATNNTHTIRSMKSANITKMIETSQPRACLI